MQTLKKLFIQPELDNQRQYFFWVDAFRVLAAIMVLFWHYQYLYYPSADKNPIIDKKNVQPFYKFFWLFYEHGAYAVPLFWVISGFVLASVYMDTKAKTKDFFINRFARLYPLHFLTLMVVGLLQLLSLLATGHYQIHSGQNIHNFVLNLLFISSWGFEQGDGFNAPIWSVSVEIFIYIVFWISIKWIFRFGVLLPVLMTLGFAILKILIPKYLFWKCGVYFFSGTIIFLILNALKNRNSLSLAIGIAGTIMGLALFLKGYRALTVLLFPSLVLLAGSVDYFEQKIGRAFKAFGDLSYGIYLWHIPVQILIILLIDFFGINRHQLVSNEFFFILFMLTVFTVAKLSFDYYENPARVFLRKKRYRAFGM